MEERLRFLEKYNEAYHTANISFETGKLLLFFVQLVSARRILEIGTSTGYSTLWFAQSGAEIHTIERRADRAAIARKSFSGIPAITLYEGNALEIIPTLSGYFDVLFLDATKREYLAYFQVALALLSPGALVMADNVISHRKKMYDFLDFVHNRYSVVEIAIDSGLLLFILPKDG